MTTYRIARTSVGTGRKVLAYKDIPAVTLGEAFAAAQHHWKLSSTRDLRCLGAIVPKLPQRETAKRPVAAPGRQPADLLASEWGSLFLLRAQTPAGEDWIDEHLPPRDSADVTTWGDSIAVEPRYLGPIMEGAAMDGLTVRVQ